MPIAGLFDVGARILRRHAPILLAVAFLIQLPAAILDAVGQQRLADSIAPLLVGLDTDTPQVLAPTDAQAGAIAAALIIVGCAMLISMILGAVATVGYACVVSNDYHARRSSLGAVLGTAFRRGLAAVTAAILAALAALGVVVVTVALALGAVLALPAAAGETGGIGVFVALVVGIGGGLVALTLAVRLTLATIIVAVEGSGPLDAIRRSWHLTGGNTWRTFTVLVILACIISILAALLSQLLGLTISDTIGARMGMVTTFDALIAAAVSVLFAPVPVVVQAVLYFDLRVRRDAWQLPIPAAQGPGTDDEASAAG
jgi:hypothetical protein